MTARTTDVDDAEDTTAAKPARRAPAKKAAAKRAQPHKPAGVKEPQDHKKPAAQREAEGDDTVQLEFHGETFEVIADQEDWPILAVQAFSRQRNIDAVEHLLGPVQWARFVTKFPKRRQFDEFGKVFAEHFGFAAAGE